MLLASPINGVRMKRIEAIVRPAKAAEVCKALEMVGHPGLTISEVMGRGAEKGAEQKARGLAYDVDLIAKARIELVVEDDETERIIEAVRSAAFTGRVGDGKIFIHPVETAVRVRTAETGEAAIR